MAELDIPTEWLDVASAAELYPSFRGDDLAFVLHEPEGGVLRADRAVRALATQAVGPGARLLRARAQPAVRLVRSCQTRCRELTVIVPDVAKSAGTLLAIGAHHTLMGPSSGLGPVDPQFQLPDGSLAAAKDIIAAVDDATKNVEAAPETYALHASLLAAVTALMVHQARAALERTDAFVEEALFELHRANGRSS
jgi:hypothetical protein